MRRVFRLLFASACVLLSIALTWSTIGALRGGAHLSSTYITGMVVVSVLFVVTALAVWRKWHGWRWLAGATGGLLLLYAVSVILLGWEDVGGPAVAIPLALLTALAGCVGLAISFKAGSPYGAA